ncbi:MAG: hypothetical protein QME96_12340 [Myxococcota bacterium]|nr:hypothetical protein [Myxococcota bacterium]
MSVDEAEGYGHTVRVSTAHGIWRGELVGCDEDGVYLLLHERRSDAARYVRWTEFDDGVIEIEGRSWVTMLLWGLSGVASTVSHGLWGMVSVPLWAAFTIAVTVGQAAADAGEDFPERDSGASSCCALAKWSRFPQGVPIGMATRYGGASPHLTGRTGGVALACPPEYRHAAPAAHHDCRADPEAPGCRSRIGDRPWNPDRGPWDPP